MGHKKQRQLGLFFVISGLLVILISSLAYFKFSTIVSTAPYTTVQLDLTEKESKKTTDLIYFKQHEKNAITVEIKHSIKNMGDRDLKKITLVSQIHQASGLNEGEFICIQSIKFGKHHYTPNKLKFLGLDINKDGKISLIEFSKSHFLLNGLSKGKEREFVLNGEYQKGLSPNSSVNQSTRIVLEITYQVE